MKRNWSLKAVVVGLVTVVLQSCGINSNLMLKTQKDYVFAEIDSLNSTKDEYRIDVNDILQLRFFTNNGQRILDVSAAPEAGQQNQLFNPNNSLSYVIQKDSLVNFPAIGPTNLVGKTIREAELFLEVEFANLYIDPFVQISVTNRRVIVFPGNGGEAKVLYLANNNTTLLEALALAGGITERGKANKIKLIRKEDGERKVYKIDLSTIDGLDYTDILVQANDYIYVEPVPELGRELLKEVTPIVSLISSAAIVISVISTL